MARNSRRGQSPQLNQASVESCRHTFACFAATNTTYSIFSTLLATFLAKQGSLLNLKMTETGDVNLEVVGSPSSLNAKEVLLGELTGDGLGGAIFNMVNSILGAGIIGIPYALRECGLLVGIFFLILVAAVTHWTTCLLMYVSREARTPI